MTRLLAPAIALALASGCIIYDEDVKYAEKHEEPIADVTDPQRPSDGSDDVSDDRGDAGDDDDDGDRPTVEAPQLELVPYAGLAGETVIATLVLSGDADVDLRDVTEVAFFGSADIEVIATLPRSSTEYLLTLAIPDDASAGFQDLIVEFGDVGAEFVRDAFLVVTDPADFPDDAWDGLPDGNGSGASGGGGNGGDGGTGTGGDGGSGNGGGSGDDDDCTCP
jgi:hypothetical protein